MMEFNPGASLHGHITQVQNAAGAHGDLQRAAAEWNKQACDAGFSEDFRQYVIQAALSE
jgi:hypothetical protein